jgi:putative two-component system response regulator
MNMSAGTALVKTLLVVDDAPENLLLIQSVLKDEYRIRGAKDGERALTIAGGETAPDLILLDVVMPGMSGHEVCRRLKADPRTHAIPVIFTTSRSESEDEQIGLDLGAVDYVTKPINFAILRARVRSHLALKDAADALRDRAVLLETEVAARTREISQIKDVTIMAMASLAEARDNETGNHVRRTQHYVRLLAERLAPHPRFAATLTPENIVSIFKSAPLHDIGKVGIPDHILCKPGRLTPEEFEIMKTHTLIGGDAIVHAEQELGVELPFFRFAKEIAYWHQEKWDGSGYPHGLAGEAIPVSARLMALADVYDALRSRRCYKPPMSHEQASAILVESSGRHFDPDIVAAFVDLQEEFQEIIDRYADPEPTRY